MATKLVSTGVQYPSGSVQTSAAAGSTHSLVANGSVGNGKVVVIRSDGKVEQVSGLNQSEDIGDEAQLAQTNNAIFRSESATVWHDNASKLVHVYRDTGNSYYPTARVGTVASDNSVSWGTAVVVSSTGISGNSYNGVKLDIEYDPSAQKVFIMFMNSVTPTGVVGTVSGTSISFGTSTTITSFGVAGLDITYNSTVNKLVVVALGYYSYQAGIKAVTVTISGTSFSWGTAVIVQSSGYIYSTNVASSDSEAKIFMGSRDNNNSPKLWALTISGTTLTVGSLFNLTTNTSPSHSSYDRAVMLFDRILKQPVLVFSQSQTNTEPNNSLMCFILGVDGTTLSVDTWHNIDSGGIHQYFTAEWDNNLKMICVFGRLAADDDDFGFWSWRIDPSAKTIKDYTKNTEIGVDTGNNGTSDQRNTLAIINTDPSRAFINYARAYYNYIQVFQITADYSANAPDFVGIAQNSASNGGNVTFTLLYGANEEQSSLTVGNDYYITYDGSLSAIPTSYPKIGVAIATDTILVGGW